MSNGRVPAGGAIHIYHCTLVRPVSVCVFVCAHALFDSLTQIMLPPPMPISTLCCVRVKKIALSRERETPPHMATQTHTQIYISLMIQQFGFRGLDKATPPPPSHTYTQTHTWQTGLTSVQKTLPEGKHFTCAAYRQTQLSIIWRELIWRGLHSPSFFSSGGRRGPAAGGPLGFEPIPGWRVELLQTCLFLWRIHFITPHSSLDEAAQTL